MAETVQQDGETLNFPNNGRGVFIYTRKILQGDVVEIYLALEHINDRTKPRNNFIQLKLDSEGAEFSVIADGSRQNIFIKDGRATGSSGLEEGKVASYWISVDRDSYLVKYGKGYMMKETTFKLIDFNDKRNQTARQNVVDTFFNATLPLYLMVFKTPEYAIAPKPLIEAEPTFQFRTRPLAGNLPPLVKDSSAVTLFDLDRGEFTFSDDMPTVCQELYNIVKGLELEYPENPVIRLSDAMQYSINTEGKFLNNIIKSKKGEFGADDEVYIRVTLGPDMRTAPGIPFVLEIWPSGCKSPIHNHGGSCAIIKVLFGRIQIRIYNKATNPPSKMEPLLKFDAKQGDFTWMDENWYQAHQLINTTNDFCATIQSYRYADNDKIKWPGFDYIKDGDFSAQKIFYPTSDTSFITMRRKVLEEYTDYISGKK